VLARKPAFLAVFEVFSMVAQNKQELDEVGRHRLDLALFQCGGIYMALRQLDVKALQDFLADLPEDFRYQDPVRLICDAALAARDGNP
jgi:hypothetical protein